jgi:hypothetical protein
VLFEFLGPHCEGLELEMLTDLLNPDEIPESRRWQDGEVRLASSFAVHSPAAWTALKERKAFTPSAEAVYEPVELLAGKDWLVTRWHDACLYRGAGLLEHGLAPVSRDGVRAAVEKRWACRRQGSPGDLGVLVMHELALTYAPTHRRFLAALEEWELKLYESDGEPRDLSKDQHQLDDLWGARARLRDWLNPLNVPGLRGDPDKAWLPATDHKAVIAVDERVDKALAALSKLGDTLRSSFHLLHIQKAEAQRDRNEELQRRVERLATIFLIPTLIVGFYGANTWVPGQQRHWGFWVMVGVMAALTCLGVAWLRVVHRRRDSARLLDRRRSFEP